MTTPNPPERTPGLGELVRAHRAYTTLSGRVFAEKLGISERSLSDIEVGRRDCPPGFIDSVERVVDAFDREVTETTEKAREMLADVEPWATIEFTVSDLPSEDWVRAVIGRAAV